MFEWITKPYIEWSVIDTILCYLEMGIGSIIIITIAVGILEIKDKIKKKSTNERQNIKRTTN